MSPQNQQRRHVCVMPFQEYPVLLSYINGPFVPKRFILRPLNSFNGSKVSGKPNLLLLTVWISLDVCELTFND